MTYHLGTPGVTHCLLIETNEDLILVDSGLGIQNHISPSHHMKFFFSICRVMSTLEETAFEQIKRLGFAPEDVKHVVLTHLHIDHAGGLPDFPWAKVHVLADEHDFAIGKKWSGIIERIGYTSEHWVHEPDWKIHSFEGEK